MNVIVTGASKGIGRAIALAFAVEGCRLILCARNLDKLEGFADEIKQQFPQTSVETFAADLSEKSQVTNFGNFCLGFGSPDIVVNNAGIYLPGSCINEEEGFMERMMALNFYSAYHLTRSLVPYMIKASKGHIFNICSVASLKAYPGGAGYSISKFALDGLSQNLRHELMPHGIKVTAVFPGAVFTDSWGDFDNSQLRIMEAADIAKMILAASKLSAQAVVEEIIIRPQLGDLP
ncbi:MAG: SDR family NAD(P)-dependent oxidoreductase [Sphingobacteriales bacterium]|jgi:short-subunit dehydrogenase|nr:SDR family NAD(P)-dependent oxidoreductase [Sphingobacteriales bacterium]